MVVVRALSLFLLIGFSINVFAARATLVTTVDRVLVTTGGAFGNCMAYLNQPLRPLGVDCPDQWVTFSCSGDIVPRSEAKGLFETAQIALATGKDVRVYVTDSAKHNGYCFANRVDLFR